LFRVKVDNEHGMAARTGTGIFPRELMNRFPLLPVEEEGRLNDLPPHENSIERIFAYSIEVCLADVFPSWRTEMRLRFSLGRGTLALRERQ
jgi:hypothetical protein